MKSPHDLYGLVRLAEVPSQYVGLQLPRQGRFEFSLAIIEELAQASIRVAPTPLYRKASLEIAGTTVGPPKISMQ